MQILRVSMETVTLESAAVTVGMATNVSLPRGPTPWEFCYFCWKAATKRFLKNSFPCEWSTFQLSSVGLTADWSYEGETTREIKR